MRDVKAFDVQITRKLPAKNSDRLNDFMWFFCNGVTRQDVTLVSTQIARRIVIHFAT